MNELQKLYARDDFAEVWLKVAGDIKIRKYKNLQDLSEIQSLPSNVQSKVCAVAINEKFNYETVVDEGTLYNTAYVVVFDEKGHENWMGMYQYNYATTLTKAVSSALGLGVCIGGVYYFVGVAPLHANTLIGYISQNYKNLQDWIIQMAGSLFSAATYVAFQKWLMNEHSEWKILVAACILKKMESVRYS